MSNKKERDAAAQEVERQQKKKQLQDKGQENEGGGDILGEQGDEDVIF